MAGDRRINWGADATDARYRTEDTGDGGNFVVAEDLDGNTVLLQWNPSTSPSQWEFAGKVDMGNNDLVNVNSLETDRVDVADKLIESGLGFGIGTSSTLTSDPSDVSNTSFQKIAEFDGAVTQPNEAPAGGTLEGNLVVHPSSVPNNETGTYRVEVLELDVGGGAANRDLTELDVDVTNTQVHHSDWQAITSTESSRYLRARNLKAKVTSGTLSSENTFNFVLLFRWVVD